MDGCQPPCISSCRATAQAVLNHFAWRRGAALVGRALALLWQDEPAERLAASQLYESDGQSYTAAMPNLKKQMVTTTDWVFGVQTALRTGTVSYPFGAQAQRATRCISSSWKAATCSAARTPIYCHRRQPQASRTARRKS